MTDVVTDLVPDNNLSWEPLINVQADANNPNLPTWYFTNPNITYIFPDTTLDYDSIWGLDDELTGLAQLSSVQQAAAQAVFNQYSQFSGLTFTQVSTSGFDPSTQYVDVRLAQDTTEGTAATNRVVGWGFLGGDPTNISNWSDPAVVENNNYPNIYTASFFQDGGGGIYATYVDDPTIGNYGYYAFLHEVGIELGLFDEGGLLPPSLNFTADTMESYNAFEGSHFGEASQSDVNSFPQTPMQLDMAAIQQMYGANFSGVGTDITYTWSPTTGEEYINGVGQGAPSGNKIFSTLWDQGATATYDLSNYSTNLDVDLLPGAWNTFSTDQLAAVIDPSSPLYGEDDGDPGFNPPEGLTYAPGNVANALLYEGDTATEITIVDGGSGHNVIIGNDVGDTIYGGTGGGNVILPGAGTNTIDGGSGSGNTLVLSGTLADYSISVETGDVMDITDQRTGTPNGTNNAVDFDNVQFDGQTLGWKQIATLKTDGALPTGSGLGVGNFSGVSGETEDLLVRNGSNNNLYAYDVSSGGTIYNAYDIGSVGLTWQVAGFGDFSSNSGETDLLMRNSSSGAFEVYDTTNNEITSAASLGTVGLDWQILGFGQFASVAGETDMLMQNTSTGDLEVYDIADNAIYSASSMGAIGTNWSVLGFTQAISGVTDMLMDNRNTGAIESYSIADNAITSSSSALGVAPALRSS